MKGVTIWTPDWAQVLKDLPADVARWQQVDGKLNCRFAARRGGERPRASRKSAAPRRPSRFDRVSVAYRGAVVLKPLTLEVAAGEILAHDRAVRLGQDDGFARRRRLRASGGRAHPHRRHRRHRPAALRARPGDGGTELRAVSAHARRRKRSLRPQRARRAKSAGRRARRRGAARRRHDRNSRGGSRANCPAASSSASRSPARSRCGRACCCSTSPCRRSTRKSAARWSRRSPGCTPTCPS